VVEDQYGYCFLSSMDISIKLRDRRKAALTLSMILLSLWLYWLTPQRETAVIFFACYVLRTLTPMICDDIVKTLALA